MLKAALNGNRSPSEHPSVPITPQQLARDAHAAVTAGADALHLHPRNAAGAESLEAGDVTQALEAVRAACPGVPVGISSGWWILPDAGARLSAVRAWTVLPDFVSVNWHEEGAPQLAELLLTRGVGVEAGLWTAEAVRTFLDWPQRDGALRVLLEMPDKPIRDYKAELKTMFALLDASDLDKQTVLHGLGESAWPLLREAGRRGLSARIGLEDTLLLPGDFAAEGNGELVRVAREMLD
ncbi:3-keto-5-aminohexanoate cleavage protein [Deinococcus arenicola]|uniref:3-keto-5-aminohexanoate cleavage protein n=1 Tax=Deinococcus arenicola TaxID=2994950 RepID=A0ABU4DU75_9DEIO|nr:3-keto-5-aminohexanoate cleavage protein [Deinococcus sp. ZS9-10]MDV6375971.1 3-keto-5-aminohexanoate cleavage protein [Deinococcus sp. ZS9-10]